LLAKFSRVVYNVSLGNSANNIILLSDELPGIRFISTAKDFPKESKYLKIRLSLEEQRLFAWSETCGLLDYDLDDKSKILESNAFGLHRTTVLELLIQIKVLFEDFEKHQKRHKGLETVPYRPEDGDPKLGELSSELDAIQETSDFGVPLNTKRKHFVEKAIKAWKSASSDIPNRVRWAAFDKSAFEGLLQKFSTLNDSITSLLDKNLQREILSVTQDTNRGVLQLHDNLADLQQLVKATLALTLQSRDPPPSYQLIGKAENNVTGLELLAELARFKARFKTFNESTEIVTPLDASTTDILKLGNPEAEKVAMEIDRACIRIDSDTSLDVGGRCEALLKRADGNIQHVWVEWKEYDWEMGKPCPSPLIIDRVQKLAALLHYEPKPKHFRVPHCLGYFDDGESLRNSDDDSLDEDNDYRIGFVFEKPYDVPPVTPSVSLLQLLRESPKPRVTQRIAIAKAIANCILYLHSVNWLHKGLRSHNIVFFPEKEPSTNTKAPPDNKINYSKPYISGFDFARPARPEEQTEIPVDSLEFNLYRHPSTQNAGLGPREAYRKSFDVYSLGVILVELAHWKTVDRVLGIDLGAGAHEGAPRARPRPKTAAGVRDRLLDELQVAALGAAMGEAYERAAWKCLAGGAELGIELGEDEICDGRVAARLSMAFYEEVVKKLEEIKV
jgi:hypothetical protein